MTIYLKAGRLLSLITREIMDSKDKAAYSFAFRLVVDVSCVKRCLQIVMGIIIYKFL